MMYIYPSCYFVGKSSTKTLKLFLNFNAVGVVLKVVLLIVLIRYFGLTGAVLSGLIIWIYRNGMGYYLVINDIRKKLVLR